MVDRFFFAVEVTLKLNIHIIVSENADETLELIAAFMDAVLPDRCSEWTMVATRQAYQSVCEFFQFMLFNPFFAFRSAHLHACDQAAQVLIPRLRFGKQRITHIVFTCQFGADV